MQKKINLLLCLLFTVMLFTACQGETPVREVETKNKCVYLTVMDESGNILLTLPCYLNNSEYVAITSLKYEEELKKTGYNFFKIVDKDGNEVKRISEDTTVYAVYSPITYNVKFSKGYGTETEEGKLPEDFTVKYDEEFTLPENKLSYNKYKKAVGWYVKTGYETSDIKHYANGEKLKNLTEKDNETIEFIADFNDYDCVIEFKIPEFREDNTTSISKFNSTTYYLDKGSILPEVPEIPARVGYTIDGWVEEDDTTNALADFTDYKVTRSVTYTPKYSPKSYKVTFETEYGTAPESKTIYVGVFEWFYEEPYKLSATGYNFEGWFDEDNEQQTCLLGDARNWKDGDLPDLHLTAKWTPWIIHQVFIDAPKDLENLPEGYYYDSSYTSRPLTRDVAYDTEVTMPDNEIYSSLPKGFKLLGWTQGDDYGNKIKKTQPDYIVSETFKNEIEQDDKYLWYHGFIEGPKIKIAVKIPESVSINSDADIKPTSAYVPFDFNSIEISENNRTLHFHYSSLDTVRIEDDYYIFNENAVKNGGEELFTVGQHSYKLSAYAGTYAGTYYYSQEINVEILENTDEILLNFDDMKPISNYRWQPAQILLNFDTAEDVLVLGVKFAFADTIFRVSDNTWRYDELVSDNELKDLIIYVQKGEDLYQSTIKVQTAAACTSSSTIKIESDLTLTIQ